MTTVNRIFASILIILLFTPFTGVSAGQGTTLFGTVGLSGKSGRFVPGGMIRIYLATEPVTIEFTPSKKLNRQRQLEATNSAHIDFFMNFRKKAVTGTYLYADTVSTIAGTFSFRDIPPGRYYVVVTFPSLIDGRKVAWQVPVDVAGEKYQWIKLRTENLALPALSR